MHLWLLLSVNLRRFLFWCTCLQLLSFTWTEAAAGEDNMHRAANTDALSRRQSAHLWMTSEAWAPLFLMRHTCKYPEDALILFQCFCFTNTEMYYSKGFISLFLDILWKWLVQGKVWIYENKVSFFLISSVFFIKLLHNISCFIVDMCDPLKVNRAGKKMIYHTSSRHAI